MARNILLGVLIITAVLLSSLLIAAFALDSKNQVENSNSLNLMSEEDEKYEQEDEAFEDENEQELPITGTALERASASALAYIGEGKVTDSEIDDEDGYYEIEITISNGEEIDVHLDKDFNIISTEQD